MHVSLDIGSKMIKLAQGQNESGMIRISKCAEAPTPAGCVENGHIKDADRLADCLRDLVKQNKFSTRDAIVALRSTDTFFKEITLPVATLPDLRKMAEHIIHSSSAAARDYSVDFTVLGEETVDGNKLLRLLTCSVPKKLVLDYYELLGSIGLVPARLDVQQNTVRKLMANGARINGKELDACAAILLDAGSAFLGLDLVVNGKSAFERTVPLRQSLAESTGFALAPTGLGMEPLSTSTQSARETRFSRIYDEIQKMMQFSLSRTIQVPVTRIYLYGGNARLEGLTDYLWDMLRVEIEVITAVSTVAIDSGCEADICNLLSCAGGMMKTARNDL